MPAGIINGHCGWLQSPFNKGLIARGRKKLGPGGGMGPARKLPIKKK